MVKGFLFFLLAAYPVSSAFTQGWNFSPPERLPGNVNTEYEETFPLLSPDGKALYFTRALYPGNQGGKFSGSDVWISTYDNTKRTWGKAGHPNDMLNSTGNNAVVGVHSSGKMVYLMDTYASKKAGGIYFTKKIGNSWSRPELIPIAGLEPQSFLGFYVSPDFEVIFISMKAADSRGEEDLYISLKNSGGRWSVPKNLGPSINTAGFEISPFLSPDKKRLYFSSSGHKGFGEADIFYCDRLYNSWDTWSSPRNLGEKLNSKKFDAYFSIYGDSIAYFSSNRSGRYADIYRINVVPGHDVLPFGQRYLTPEEVSRALGANVSRKIIFEKNTATLTAPQEELLFFIADKLNEDRTVNLHLAVIEENNPQLSEERLQAIASHLRESGVESVRLLLTNSDRAKKVNNDHTTIELLLFK